MLCAGLSLVAASGGYSSLRCTGFSLQWLLLLQSTGSRHVGSVVVAHRLQQLWLTSSRAQASSCGARASLLHSMWDLPGPGLEPVSPALAGRFFTTESPGKSLASLFFFLIFGCAACADLSSPNRDQTSVPCSGSVESQPLDHQGSPWPPFKCLWLPKNSLLLEMAQSNVKTTFLYANKILPSPHISYHVFNFPNKAKQTRVQFFSKQ